MTKLSIQQFHDEEENINLSMGVHILSNCKNVSVSGNAVILEAIGTPL